MYKNKWYGRSFFYDFLYLKIGRVKYKLTQEKCRQYVHTYGYLFMIATQHIYKHIAQIS